MTPSSTGMLFFGLSPRKAQQNMTLRAPRGEDKLLLDGSERETVTEEAIALNPQNLFCQAWSFPSNTKPSKEKKVNP